ncbi:hypothetical protein PHLCEN_2v8988 [Hermanssonia centrifuga]|uniref:Uncharacterized protein n=1 Tax=Hermanssonia centrifuga TaxID=98765 RepID=A0A2R6NS51_9APHY|nr:hypothetical protein PHLCEN_2v8988 [Hermanssonia centrifuga]
MPNSTVSLDSLSSPSPSPSPPPQGTHTSASNHSGAGAGLDSGSELSELTEDEQENTKSKDDREERARPIRRGRKRGGIVPAPMWDWAYKSNRKDPKSKMHPEEEEEEQAGPATAMEEEEDDDQDDRSNTGDSLITERRRRRAVDDHTIANHKEAQQPGSVTSPLRVTDGVANDPEYVSEEDEGELVAEVEDDDAPDGDDGGVESSQASDDENIDDDDGELGVDKEQPEDDDGADTNVVIESEDDAEEGVEPAEPTPLPIAPAHLPLANLPVLPIEGSAEPEPASVLMDVDDIVPETTQVSPIIAAAAASSIMAGNTVIRPPSPTPSASSAEGSLRNRSPADSRSPSPEALSDREKRGAAKTRAKVRVARSTRSRNRRKPKTEATVEQEADADVALVDDRDLDADDIDVDTPEMEMEAELQPAHRAEALDVLATIELKYALLRERLYVEKMENLAWEEALVLEGTHPEMLHLHAELSKRRDKRLELASRRREFEVVNATKRRKLEEDAVWSWWKLRRDELQTVMISEANRKRRKLDRVRRALDRPQPVRHIPSPIHDLPPVPTLRELVRGDPFNSPDSKKRQPPLSSLAYPQLSTLPPIDIANDIEYLNGHRRSMNGLDLTRTSGMGMNPLGHPSAASHGFDYNLGMGIVDGAQGRYPPMPFPQPQMMPGYSGSAPPRLPHHHSAPLPNMNHPQMVIEQDMVPIHRPGSRTAQPNPHMPQYPANGPGITSLDMRARSISPVSIQSLNSAPNAGGISGPSSLDINKSNGWVGMNGPGPSSISSAGKDFRRTTMGVRNMDIDILDREKDRERERITDPGKVRDLTDREWERERRDREQERDIERSNHVPQAAQRHPSHQYPHVHPPAGPAAHLPHNHQHHHHHVVHHHHSTQGPHSTGQQPNSVPSHAVNGSASGRTSPIGSREFEPRRTLPDVPMEIDSLKTGLSTPTSSHWKGDGEQASLSPEFPRERPRPSGPSVLERMAPSFVMTPSQASQVMQASFSPASRNQPGTSTAPASIASSRRGSWSALEENGVARPASSASAHLSGVNSVPPSHLHPSSLKRPHASPSLQSQRSPPSMLISPHNNGIRLPPLSPSNALARRSPFRIPQPLPPSPLPPHMTIQSKPPSPQIMRRSPPPQGAIKSPEHRELRLIPSGSAPIIVPAKTRPVSPVSLIPRSSSPIPLLAQPPTVGAGLESGISQPKLSPIPS